VIMTTAENSPGWPSYNNISADVLRFNKPRLAPQSQVLASSLTFPGESNEMPICVCVCVFLETVK